MLSDDHDNMRLELMDKFFSQLESIFNKEADDRFYTRYPQHEGITGDELYKMFLDNFKNMASYRPYLYYKVMYTISPDWEFPYLDPVIPAILYPKKSIDDIPRSLYDFMTYRGLWDWMESYLEYANTRMAKMHEPIRGEVPFPRTWWTGYVRRELYQRMGLTQFVDQSDMMDDDGIEIDDMCRAILRERNIDHSSIHNVSKLKRRRNSSSEHMTFFIANDFRLHHMRKLILKVLDILHDHSKPTTIYISSFEYVDPEVYSLFSQSEYLVEKEELEGGVIMLKLSNREGENRHTVSALERLLSFS